MPQKLFCPDCGEPHVLTDEEVNKILIAFSYKRNGCINNHFDELLSDRVVGTFVKVRQGLVEEWEVIHGVKELPIKLDLPMFQPEASACGTCSTGPGGGCSTCSSITAYGDPSELPDFTDDFNG